jgi:hypothetical protein
MTAPKKRHFPKVKGCDHFGVSPRMAASRGMAQGAIHSIVGILGASTGGAPGRPVV